MSMRQRCTGGQFCECANCEREKHLGQAPRDPIGGLVGLTGREYERMKAENAALTQAPPAPTGDATK